ncbi:radical SAM protein [bacterium]|nr:radical SAM protein [bacterium]
MAEKKIGESSMKITSVCPVCFRERKIKIIPAQLIEKDNQIWIEKECPEHGRFEDIVFKDASLWKRWRLYTSEGRPPKVPFITSSPDGQKLYQRHRSWPLLVNLLVTNRCDLRCWYCFMNAGRSGYVYEPSLDSLEKMMQTAKKAGGIAIQITGGEPTVREDIIDILKIARELFSHVQLNTNGIRIADDQEFAQKLKGLVNTIYMSFDGVTREKNPWIDYSKKALDNLRKAGFVSVVLVPTVTQENLPEAGKIVKFALENKDIIRGVIFQPIAMAGSIKRVDPDFLKKFRVDYVDIIETIEKEFNGDISRDDFYPVAFVDPVRKLIEKIRDKEYPGFVASSMCGGATYVFWDQEKKKPIPITRFIDVEGLREFIIKDLLTKKGIAVKAKIAASFIKNVNRFVIKENLPSGLQHPIRMIVKAVIGGDYNSLRVFHYNSILIGAMWFQDPWNIQLQPRVERCVIQYVTEEGLISFCLYNGLGFGDELRKRYGMSIKEWEKKTGKKLSDDIWEKARKDPVLLTGRSK